MCFRLPTTGNMLPLVQQTFIVSGILSSNAFNYRKEVNKLLLVQFLKDEIIELNGLKINLRSKLF